MAVTKRDKEKEEMEELCPPYAREIYYNINIWLSPGTKSSKISEGWENGIFLSIVHTCKDRITGKECVSLLPTQGS